jgi:hypothetical protein
LGLPEPIVRGTDPDPAPDPDLLSSSKKKYFLAAVLSVKPVPDPNRDPLVSADPDQEAKHLFNLIKKFLGSFCKVAVP